MADESIIDFDEVYNDLFRARRHAHTIESVASVIAFLAIVGAVFAIVGATRDHSGDSGASVAIAIGYAIGGVFIWMLLKGLALILRLNADRNDLLAGLDPE